MSELEREIESVLNRHSAENESDTPDFILAEFLRNSLAAFNSAVRSRDKWYDFNPWERDNPLQIFAVEFDSEENQ